MCPSVEKQVLINLKSVNVNVLAKLQILKDCCLNYVAGYEVSTYFRTQ